MSPPLTSPADADRVRRRLTRRYVVALAAIAIALAAAYGLVETSLQRHRATDSRELNLAGRQRMLSQRIAKTALVARATGDGAALATLDVDVREWEGVHRALLDGRPAQGLRGLEPPLDTALDSLTGAVEQVRAAAGALGDALGAGDPTRADEAVAALLRGERDFVGGMDRVVFALDAKSAEAIGRLQGAVHLLFLALIAVFAAIAWFVLRPSVVSVARAVEQAAEQNRLLRTVIDTIPDHIYVKDVTGRATLRNVASARALGFDDPEASVGLTDAEVSSDPVQAELGQAALLDDLHVIRTGEPILNKEEKSADDGWFLTTKVPLLNEQGEAVGIVGVTRDVTEARAAEAKFRGLVEHSVAGTVIIQDGHFAYANPRMDAIFGYAPGEMLGLPALSIIHEGDRATVAENLRRRIDREVEALSYAVRGCRKDGRVIHIELAGVAGEHEGSPAVIGTVVDVTEREEMERALYHQAHHDDLTGLPNRALFGVRLEVAVATAERDGDFAVLFLDLDRFKAVNDTLGHSAGDRLLREVATRIQGALRPTDTVARLGGDEFAVLLAGLPYPGHAQDVAVRIQEALRAPVALDGHDLVVAASIGVVLGRTDHASPDAVLREADLAMYDAKAAGRGRSATYSSTGHLGAARQSRLEVDLRHAVERDELRLAYQPIVRLADGALTGFEALVRWEHPELGLLAPDAFIGPAEASGQLTRIDRWVLREACRQMAAWESRLGRGLLVISVNCTGRDLLEGSYTDDVRRVPEAEGFDARRLLLEITETLILDDADAVAAELRSLQAGGVRFCVDDFGTGYSSLSTLHTLPVDTIKVDRSFVSALDADDRSRQLVQTVVGLGHLLGKSVVAEGIETPAHLAALRAMDCAYGQGYLFDRPLAPEEASALIAAESLPWQHHWAETEVAALAA